MIRRALNRGLITLLAAFLVTSTIGCTRTIVHSTPPTHGHSPPPQAPAHGQRQKDKQDHKLVYDKTLRLYVVSGHPQHYFYRGQYYRYAYGTWQRSSHLKGPWKTAKVSSLPPKLRKPHEKAKYQPPKDRGPAKVKPHEKVKYQPPKDHGPLEAEQQEEKAQHQFPKDPKHDQLEKEAGRSPDQDQRTSKPTQ